MAGELNAKTRVVREKEQSLGCFVTLLVLEENILYMNYVL